MLIFNNPALLWLLLLIIPVLFFYFLRMLFKKQLFSSNYIWKKIIQEKSGRDRMRYFHLLLLLLQIMSCLSAGLAASNLMIAVKKQAKPGVVFMLDNSASMQALEKDALSDLSRFELAKNTLINEVNKLDKDTRMVLFIINSDLNLAVKPTFSKSDIIGGLDKIQVTNASVNEEAVTERINSWLLTQNQFYSGCLITDGGFDLSGRNINTVFKGGLNQIIIGNSVQNIGISGLRIQNDRTAVFTVFNNYSENKNVMIELYYENNLIAEQTLNVKIGITNHTFAPADEIFYGAYALKLKNNNDAFSADDASYYALNKPRTAQILFVGESNIFIKAGLKHPYIDMDAENGFISDDPSYYESYDLVINNGENIPESFNGNLLSFMKLPVKIPVIKDKKVSGMLDKTNSFHPVLRYINWETVMAADADSFMINEKFNVLARINNEPVIILYENDGYKQIFCGIDLLKSNLGVSESFPILMQNIIQFTIPQWGNTLSYNFTAGEEKVFSEKKDWFVREHDGIITSRKGNEILINPVKAGIYHWESSSDRGALAVNIPSSEMDITPSVLALDEYKINIISDYDLKKTSIINWLSLAFLVFLFMEWILWRVGFLFKDGASTPQDKRKKEQVKG